MVRAKKIPLRQCLGCMESKPKKELIRVVRSKDGQISIDKTGKLAGRGAYICDDIQCFNKLKKKRGLNRAFSQEISEEIYEQLCGEIKGDEK
ncbi:MAG: YlxR family protein [Anaeromicrobium sp.]|jgi:predicted RNA-binding protein YlxR (DUF448 family)|uniref:RNase P modulator RnpM n=1 Tax=Anaeromicrobium sp. TaxID=1929132 RepID=UPI0025F08B41|nr:YlxR family protein [Anaeromicrobium sp.]MCT4595626.1 YlxR family protein [Anaeromicrobium sp.]